VNYYLKNYNKKILLKVIFLLLFLTCFKTNVFSLDIQSQNGVLINLNDNTIIDEKSKDEVVSIASLTKIMTSLVAIENIDDLEQKVVIKNTMFSKLIGSNAYIIYLKDGQQLTIKDLLYATFISSAADATMALVLSLTNTEKDFVDLMNKKAEEIGLKNTKFANPVGLDDEFNYSTVYEVSKLLNHALENPEFEKLFETKKYTLSDQSQTLISSLNSYNKHGYNFDNIIGSKTGFTSKAGLSLASIYNDNINNIKYMLVTTGGGVDRNNPIHVIDAFNIYNYYQENFKYHKVFNKGDLILEVEVKNKDSLKYYIDKEIYCFSDKSFDKTNVIIDYNGIKYIDKTMNKKEKLGTIKIIYDNETLFTKEIELKENIRYDSYLSYLIISVTAVVGVVFVYQNKIKIS
jgi:D-alanyl-D-alanine carboxypeptidase (penicillin-binding protein 5/6)